MEGAEPLVIKGMRKIILRSRDRKRRLTGVMEFSHYILSAVGFGPSGFLEELERDFAIYLISSDGQPRLASSQEIVSLAQSKKHINLFLELKF